MRIPETGRTLLARAAIAAVLLALASSTPYAQATGDLEGLEAYARAQFQGRSQEPEPLTISQARRSIREAQPHMTLRQSIRVCGDQTRDQATARIEACTRLLESRKVAGETAGVTYALRGLAYLDRADVPNAIADLDRAVRLAPEFGPAYQNRGNAWYAKGNFGRAIADYDEAIRLEPATASAYVNRATAKRDLGLRDEALADYQKAIELDPKRASPYRGRGQIYLRQKDYARAIDDFDHAVRYDRSAANMMLRAEAHREAGHLDKALVDYAEAARIEPANVGVWIAQGAIWQQNGDADRALALYQKAVQTDQNSAISYRYLAEGYRAKGDRKRALNEISRALKFSWRLDFLALRAQWRLADGDLAGAETDAGYIDKFEDDNPAALAVRGGIAARRKDHAQALAKLDAALKADKSLGFAYAERGLIHAAKSDVEAAMRDLTRAVAMQSADAAVFRERAQLFKAKGELAKAIDDIGEAIKREPKSAALYYQRAIWRKTGAATEQALADFNDAIARGIDKADAYYQRATIRIAKGDRAGAIADLNAAIKRDGQKAGYFRSRGAVLLTVKAYDKAVNDFDAAIRLAPGEFGDYFQRGLAREQTGDIDKAAADFTLALSYKRDNAEAQKALYRVQTEIKRRRHEVAVRETAETRKKRTELALRQAAERAAKAKQQDGPAIAIVPIESAATIRHTASAVPLPAARPRIASRSNPDRETSARLATSKNNATTAKNEKAKREHLARARYLRDQRRKRAIRQYYEQRAQQRGSSPQFTDAFRGTRR